MLKLSQKKTTEFEYAFGTLISDMFERISDEANLKSTKDEHARGNKPDGKTQAYVCIHLPATSFVQAMLEALNHLTPRYETHERYGYPSKVQTPFKFLDVGCGVGQKVYMAQRLFEHIEAFGLELRPEHVQIARETLTKYMMNHRNSCELSFKDENIIQDNAITFNRYSEFDIIYFYCPSSDDKTEIELERSIARGAKVGAVVVGALSKYFGQPNFVNEVQSLGWRLIQDTVERCRVWKRVSAAEHTDFCI